MGEVGKNLVSGIWEGIKNAKDWLLNKIKEWCGNILNGIKSFFGIHSPSKVFKDEIGTNLALGLGEGFSKTMKDVSEEMSASIPTEFDVNSRINSTSNTETSKIGYLKQAFIEAFREFKPTIILNGEIVGEYAFEYSNGKLGKYY